MAQSELDQALRPYNSHWSTGRASPLIRKHPTARRSFRRIRARIQELPYEVLAGPRQVGKTTLVGNLIDDLLQQGIAAERILFVPCDLPAVNLETNGQAGPLVEYFEERILKAPLADLDGPAFLFLDEVHELDQWSRQLKALYDTFHPHLRVFATGSSSLSLLNPPSADLPGRVRTSQIYPLKFNEAVEMKMPDLAMGHEAHRIAHVARDALKANLDRTGILHFRDALDALHQSLHPAHSSIVATFHHYATRGGFPAALGAESDSDAFLFLEQTIDLTLSRDLTRHPKVRKVHAFRTFLAQLARQHGGKFVPYHVANKLDLDRSTIVQWKEIAEELFLVQQLPALNRHLNPLPHKEDKAYIVDPGARAFLSTDRTLEQLETSGRIGAVVEGIVHDHVRRLQFNLFDRRTNRLGYLPKPEVDLMAETPGGWLALEVKYSDRADVGVKQLARVELPPKTLRCVLTRNRYDPSGPVWQVPAWLFCFIC